MFKDPMSGLPSIKAQSSVIVSPGEVIKRIVTPWLGSQGPEPFTGTPTGETASATSRVTVGGSVGVCRAVPGTDGNRHISVVICLKGRNVLLRFH